MSEQHAVVAAVLSESSAAARDQTYAPSEWFTGTAALQRAVRSDSDWVWLLAEGAEPYRDALASLLAAAQTPHGRPPVIVAGATQGASGATVVRHLPAGNEHSPAVVEAVARHTLPIRNTTFANCLVARTCFERHGLPDGRRYGPFAPVEWSARVLREEPGVYAPASLVTVTMVRSRQEAVAAVRSWWHMMRTGTWTRGEALANLRWCVTDALTPAAAERSR